MDRGLFVLVFFLVVAFQLELGSSRTELAFNPTTIEIDKVENLPSKSPLSAGNCFIPNQLQVNKLVSNKHFEIREDRILVHKIAKGETLSALANVYQCTVEDLIAWNKIANPDFIIAGDYLNIIMPPILGKRKSKVVLVQSNSQQPPQGETESMDFQDVNKTQTQCIHKDIVGWGFSL